MGRPSKSKNQKKERAAALQQAQQDFGSVPHSFVFHRGRVGKSVRQLVTDVRKVMEPYTARALTVRKNNSLKDFVAVAGPLGVTHFLLFTKSSSSINFKLFRLPGGPTLTFKVMQYSLIRDVVSSLKRHRMHEQQFTHPPLLVLSNLGLQQMQLKLTATMFQGMFPSINVHRVNLNSIKRCLLITYDAQTQLLDFRHYPSSSSSSSSLQQREGRARGGEQRPEEAAAGEVPQHEPLRGHQRAAGERREPVGERSGAGWDPQRAGAATGLRGQRQHEGSAERRAPHRDRATDDAAAHQGGGRAGAGQRALPQLRAQGGGGGEGDPGAEGSEAAAQGRAAQEAGGGCGTQAAAARGAQGEEPGRDPAQAAAGRGQRRRGSRRTGAAGGGRAVGGGERRRVLPAGAGPGARYRSLSQPHQEEATPLRGGTTAGEAPAAQPAPTAAQCSQSAPHRAQSAPQGSGEMEKGETSPGGTEEKRTGTGETEEGKSSSTKGLTAPGSGQDRGEAPGAAPGAPSPGGGRCRGRSRLQPSGCAAEEGAGAAAVEGEDDFPAAQTHPEGETLRLGVVGGGGRGSPPSPSLLPQSLLLCNNKVGCPLLGWSLLCVVRGGTAPQGSAWHRGGCCPPMGEGGGGLKTHPYMASFLGRPPHPSPKTPSTALAQAPRALGAALALPEGGAVRGPPSSGQDPPQTGSAHARCLPDPVSLFRGTSCSHRIRGSGINWWRVWGGERMW